MSFEFPESAYSIRAILLIPFAALYWLGWRVYEYVYQLGWKKPKRPHTPVLVVGNLTVGGMGKTPITMEVVRSLQRIGKCVVISASGYGSPRAQLATLAPDGPLNPAEWGDEPALLRDFLPDVPLIIGRNRVIAAEICHREFPDAVLVLDDGYQHKPLYKDISILVDPARPRNHWVLPAGPYREPHANRSRADARIPSDFKVVLHTPQVRINGGEPEDWPAESRVQLLTAIANPIRILHTIEDFGPKIGFVRTLPDHHPLQSADVFDKMDPNLPIIVTEKDWVKLKRRPDIGNWTIWVVTHDIRFESPTHMDIWLNERLEKIAKA